MSLARPLERAARALELGDAFGRQVLGVGLLLREVGALDALLDLIAVSEHADVDVGAHHAVQNAPMSVLSRSAKRPPASRIFCAAFVLLACF